ncbi:hypothetical protein BH11ARM2_BH11ARM2_30050 [soil metagenome]
MPSLGDEIAAATKYLELSAQMADTSAPKKSDAPDPSLPLKLVRARFEGSHLVIDVFEDRRVNYAR